MGRAKRSRRERKARQGRDDGEGWGGLKGAHDPFLRRGHVRVRGLGRPSEGNSIDWLGLGEQARGTVEARGSRGRAVKDPRGFFERNLELIDSISINVCRRYGCREADMEDFVSAVHVKLLENDCACLRQFKGRSSVPTFLSFVITNLFRDRRNREWGKWRASTVAKRLGREAMLLERLTTRDGRTLDEAVEILVTNHGVGMRSQELWALWHQLPEKTRRWHVPLEEIEELPVEGGTTSRVRRAETEQAGQKVAAILREAFETLPEEDRLLLRLFFEDGLSVAKIARSLGMNQRRLYYRRDISLKLLRYELEKRGIDGELALRAVGWRGWQKEGRKRTFVSVYESGGEEASLEEDDLGSGDSPRPGSPGGPRRRAPGGQRAATDADAPGHL